MVIYRNDSSEGIYEMERMRTSGCMEKCEEHLFVCEFCGGEIYNGEEYLDCEEGIYCRSCVDVMEPEEILSLLGFEFKRAQRFLA